MVSYMADPNGLPVRLLETDVGRACTMLSRAFFRDPKMLHLISDIALRTDQSQHLFSFELRYGMIYGEVYTTSPAVEGVAVWLPSDNYEISLWRAFRCGGLGLQWHLGTQTMDRLMAFSAAVDELHKKHLPFPHYYLFFPGSAPYVREWGTPPD
jgi:hypothetical protein